MLNRILFKMQLLREGQILSICSVSFCGMVYEGTEIGVLANVILPRNSNSSPQRVVFRLMMPLGRLQLICQSFHLFLKVK